MFVDTIQTAEEIPSKRSWQLRCPWWEMLPMFGSFEALEAASETQHISLAVLRPTRLVKFEMLPVNRPEWTEEEMVKVGRRNVLGSEPESASMMGVGLVALVANVTCLVLIAKKRDRSAHIKASYIFSANDALANIGVINAGVLEHLISCHYSDLIIGTFIRLIVLNGARRILKLT